MSRKRLVKGKTTKITRGNHTIYSKENVTFNAKKVNMKGAADGVIFEDPITLEIDDEKPVDVEIGVFFDGTGNNKFNTDIGVDGAPSKTKAFIGSYENDYSNVARLFDLYPDKQELIGKRQKIVIRIYVQGIGTLEGKRDDVITMGTGEDTPFLAKTGLKVLWPFGGIVAEGYDIWNGDRGVTGKVNDGIDQIVKRIKDAGVKRIDTLTFDVFGFSRGAAAARHFCNGLKEEVTETHRKYNMGGWQDTSYTETTTTNEGGGLYKKLKSKVSKLPQQFNVRFVGLFDTVAAILKVDAGDFKIEDASHHGIKLNLAAVNAKQVVHLTARDEHRKNFALNETNVGYSFSMPGVHSDIGGGYKTGEEKVYLGFGTKATDKARLEQERLQWIAEGWYLPDDIEVIDKSKTGYEVKYYPMNPRTGITTTKWFATKEEAQQFYDDKNSRSFTNITKAQLAINIKKAKPIYLYLLEGTKIVDNRYTYIPLRIMHELAQVCEVPFDIIEEGKHKYPDKLEQVYKTLHTIAFTDENPLITYEDSRLLKLKFIHQSAHYEPLIGEVGEGYMYSNVPTKERIKHKN